MAEEATREEAAVTYALPTFGDIGRILYSNDLFGRATFRGEARRRYEEVGSLWNSRLEENEPQAEVAEQAAREEVVEQAASKKAKSRAKPKWEKLDLAQLAITDTGLAIANTSAPSLANTRGKAYADALKCPLTFN